MITKTKGGPLFPSRMWMTLHGGVDKMQTVIVSVEWDLSMRGGIDLTEKCGRQETMPGGTPCSMVYNTILLRRGG